MTGKWKQFLAGGMCACLLMGATACGEKQEEKKSEFQQALEAIEQRKYEAAYTLLKESKDRRAAEELEKFVFVPVQYTVKNSYGTDNTYTYTYDALGNLLSRRTMGADGNAVIEYTYSGYKMTSYRRQSAYATNSRTYTYDAAGNLLMVRYLDRNGDWLGQTIYTYDAAGRCLSEEKATMEEASDLTPQLDHTAYRTYDEKGRVLSEICTYYYEGVMEQKSTIKCVYEQDGSYCETRHNEGSASGMEPTYIEYYDAQGKPLRGESWEEGAEEPYYTYVYSYNDRGDVETYRSQFLGQEEVETYVYDEAGRLLEKQKVTPKGNVLAAECNTYDEQGNRLTHETANTEGNYWSKEVCTYDAEGRLLTEKYDHNSGWESSVYTYDEQGRRIKDQQETDRGSRTQAYTYDEWGNVSASSAYDVQQGAEYASEKSVQWQLQYYPEGVPAEVQDAIGMATIVWGE